VALQLLTTADAGLLDELGRARVDLLHAQVAYAQNRGSDAPPLLLRAAKRLEPLDVGLARATYLEALAAAQFAGRFAVDGDVVEVTHAALAAPPASQRPRATARADGCAGCLRVAQLLDVHRWSASTRTSLPRPSIRAIA
jgi:hypothetical protein